MASATLSAAYAAIERFLAAAQQPIAVEKGAQPIPLVAGSFEVMLEGERLTFQAWTRDSNLFRRITGLAVEAQGHVDLTIARFGGKAGTLQLIDAARPAAAKLTRRAARHNFGEQFRRFLQRQYPSWRLAELSSDPDLQHSLSPAYPRALLRRGTTGVAAIGAPGGGDVDGALTFGLVWLDYLRKRERTITVEGLVLLLPAGQEATTCHRIRHLDASKATFVVFAATDGWEKQVDIPDAGNIATELAVPGNEHNVIPDWLQPLANLPGIECVRGTDASSFRVEGLEFLRCSGTDVRFGMGTKRAASPHHFSEIMAIAREIAQARRSGAHTQNPLYAAAPERWLESRIRAAAERLDARLQPEPLYSQAPTIAGAKRGVIDLLAVATDGLLTVIELKAEEDPHLPLQALEYHARVQWHLERGEFEARGYFRGLPLRRAVPRILLVAPALHFHSTTETILQFFPPHIEVERIGVAAGWRAELCVVSRSTAL